MEKTSSEISARKLQKFLADKAEEVLGIVRKIVLEDQKKIKCKEITEALNYLARAYWLDKTKLALPTDLHEIIGRQHEITKSVAVPLVLIDKALDVHDDIVVGSMNKYGESTIYGKFGRDIALLVGDAILLKGLILLQKTVNSYKEKIPALPTLRERTTTILSISQETHQADKIMDTVRKTMKERSLKPLEMAKKEVFVGETKNKEVQKALDHFVAECWQEMSPALSPTLISLASEAVGGDSEATTPIATSMLLMAMGIKVHDDIIDNSKTKEGHLTIFGKFGTNTALIAGRVLIVKAFKLLHKASAKVQTDKIVHILEIIQRSFFEFGVAEALELKLRGDLCIMPQEYIGIVEMKASMTEAETQIGGIIGGATRKEIKILGEYGSILGKLAMIRDEFIDIFEIDELQHRMANECLPLPILCALQNKRAKEELMSILKNERLSEKSIETLVNVVYNTEEVATLKKKIQNLYDQGLSKLASLPQNEATKLLKLLLLATISGL